MEAPSGRVSPIQTVSPAGMVGAMAWGIEQAATAKSLDTVSGPEVALMVTVLEVVAGLTVTPKVWLVLPEATMTDVGTSTSEGLLLVSVTVVALATAAPKATVPEAVAGLPTEAGVTVTDANCARAVEANSRHERAMLKTAARTVKPAGWCDPDRAKVCVMRTVTECMRFSVRLAALT
jgi:hypothetical protein